MRYTIIVLMLMASFVSAQINEGNSLIVSPYTCINYAPKVCLLKGGICYDTPCPDCVCRIWVSDSKGRTIVNGESMKVMASNTCCYMVTTPPFMEGGQYSAFFNAVSPTYGEGNDTGDVYITSVMSASLMGTTSGSVDASGVAVKTSSSSDFMACEVTCAWGDIGCAMERLGCKINFWLRELIGIPIVGGITTSIASIIQAFASGIGWFVYIFVGVIKAVYGLANPSTRDATLTAISVYVWDMSKSFLTLFAPLILLVEIFIVYRNCAKSGINAFTGFVSDNVQMFSMIVQAINYILGMFLSVINSFVGMFASVNPVSK